MPLLERSGGAMRYCRLTNKKTIMKVFVVVKELTYGGVTDEVIVKAYFSHEMARNEFDKIVEEERKYAMDDNWEFSEGKDSFTSYEDGRYLENHSCVYIQETDVE